MTPRAVPKRAKIVPKRLQDGLEEVFFSHRFLHRFLVAFWRDFGGIWGGFWDPKSVIFGIDFLMIFVCRSKVAPRAAKSSSRATKGGPRACAGLVGGLLARFGTPLGGKIIVFRWFFSHVFCTRTFSSKKWCS